MGKRTWSVALSLALVAGLFSALPVSAQEAAPVAIPGTVQIEDPFQDANYLNDQGNGGTSVSGTEIVPRDGDHVTPADASTVADLGKIWFENDAESVTVFIQTQLPLGANAPAYMYDVLASPGQGSVSSSTFWCIRFTAIVPGVAQGQATTWHGGPAAKMVDRCNVGPNLWSNSADGEMEILPGPDGTGVIKLNFPRSYSPLLAKGQSITAPYARVGNMFGVHPDAGGPGGVSAPYVDNTKIGTDYAITDGGSVAPPPEPKPEPPSKSDPPGKGKKKGCGKGKGKKKGACPGQKPEPPSDACPAYVPGEDGAEAETSVVTDAATEEAPVVVETEAEMGGPSSPFVDVFDLRSFVFQNIQVDSANPDAGLYVKIEFTEFHDYDLGLFHSDGTEAASSGESQPEPGLGAGSPEGAWEGGSNYEFLKGIRTTDCAGYTARVAGYLTTGGPVTISMWLGDVVADPAAPGGGETAMEMFYRALGL